MKFSMSQKATQNDQTSWRIFIRMRNRPVCPPKQQRAVLHINRHFS
uniref:Uncharacterized protein n=1 Tax=Anguilla anguilla TaxID=7936 RepID=A0A0E9X0N1_ANGAN